MLYQKLSSISSFNPSSSSSPPPFPSLLLPLSPLSSQLKLKENMECSEAKALKTSCYPEMTQQVFSEDLWTGNGGNNVSGDDFFVDGFLDFSNDDVEGEEEEGEEEKGHFSVSSQYQNSNSSRGFSVKDDFGSVPESELSVPEDDLENLEWLSHFVDDSFSEFSLQYLPGTQQEKTQTPKQSRSEPDMGTPSFRTTGFLTSVPSKARSKRSRTGGRVWSLGSLSFTESSSSSSSSSSSISSPSSRFIFNPRQNLELFNYFGKPPAKKQKKKPVTETGLTQQQRRCSHCGVQKTPQWRTGPLGAKTLCNACGVRYKSGRLLPEYRPACSPTFSSDVHSNNHRKVLEMRRKKETVQPENGLGPAVQSF